MSDNFNPDKAQNRSCQIGSNGDNYVECTECGAAAEIGTVIRAGDDVYSGTITSDEPLSTESMYKKCQALAEDICSDVKAEFSDEDSGKVRKYTFAFTCTAEKMIFEMRLRNLR